MRSIRDALIFHLLFGAAAYAVFALLRPPQLGLGILGLVVVYNGLFPIVAQRCGHQDWLDLWLFLLPLSVFQVVPDWMLSQLLGILQFPDVGAPRIGTVPVYMAGMWVIPLFWALWPAGRSVPGAAVLALLIFGASEWAAPLIRLWAPEHVRTSFGIAHYVLLPEALLGGAAAVAFRWSLDRGFAARVSAAAAVSLFYSGALVISYFLLERAKI
jgi:hypothetical protein